MTQDVMTAAAKLRWYNTKNRKGMCACFQEKYYIRHVLLGLLYVII